ncbi:MAG: hypothetical protein FWD39_06540 [Clostridiales bacterium]|nr:hypothetical protein [Clostridiales bacterium]
MYELLTTLLQAVLAAAVPVVAAFAAKLLHAKAEESREDNKEGVLSHAKWQATDAVAAAVAHTSQTYVDELRKSGQFSPGNQAEALRRARETAKDLLTRDAHSILQEAYGSVNDYLETLIEAEIKNVKPGLKGES